MKWSSMFEKTRKYCYNKLCCNKHISDTTQLNETSEYFSNYLENISIKTTSNESIHKWILPRITRLSNFPWKKKNSDAVYSDK